MFIVLWVIFAFITAAIAESKGRSVIGWFFVGLLLGIFAIILIAVSAPQGKVAEEKQRLAPGYEAPTQTLERLAYLYQQGVLTEAEFDDQKQKVLTRV